MPAQGGATQSRNPGNGVGIGVTSPNGAALTDARMPLFVVDLRLIDLGSPLRGCGVNEFDDPGLRGVSRRFTLV